MVKLIIVKDMLNNVYRNKSVLITGHTGFKGTWMCTWLLKLGAKVSGYSIDIPSKPSMFEELGIENRIRHYYGDIRDLNSFRNVVNEVKPDFIFHLAAQAIVSTSYSDPTGTISTNVIGTMNLLEILKEYNKQCVSVFITSDKCYNNVEWIYGYREQDEIGGKDIYSGSKGAAELIIRSYLNSFFLNKNNLIKIGVGRAGNVIGGGDWSLDRIVADCFRSWNSNSKVEIRSPNATRPWQHVLEPLSGYLALGVNLYLNDKLNGEPFNFGPRAEQNHSVLNLIEDLAVNWGFENAKDAYVITDNMPFYEAGLLKLNCDKALFYLKWEPNLFYNETTRFVGEWYSAFYKKSGDIYEFTLQQIEEFEEIAISRNRNWTK